MKNKHLVVGLAIALAAFTCRTAQAQIGGAAASGDVYTSSGGSGNMGQTDYQNSGKQAFHVSDSPSQIQNYISPDSPNPAFNSQKNAPYVVPTAQVKHGFSGMSETSTAPMAPGSVDMTPFPSGQFAYGFPNAPVQPYTGPYNKNGPHAGYGGMLPNTSLGSVDFNTVDTTGIAPAGMISPGRGMGSPIARPIVQIPGSTSSTQSTLNWLQNSFFGP